MGYVNKTYLSTQFKNFADKIAKVFSKIGHTHLKSDITDFPTSMPANGGNAATVGGHTVGVNVPSNAKFTDTTYGAATSSVLGLVKSGTDITVDSSGNVNVNDDSHNHVISNVDGLQSALDGKAASSHTHNYAGSSSAGGSANTALGLSSFTISNIDELDSFLTASANNAIMKYAKASNCNIGFVSNDGLVISLPWSSTYGAQIAIDDQSNWMGIRTKNNGTWNSWSKIALESEIDSKLSGKANSSHTHTSVNGVTPEWLGSISFADTEWLAAWTSDGTKIKSLNKNCFATASHTHLKSDITDFPTSLPANGGTADKIGHALTINYEKGAATVYTFDGSQDVNLDIVIPTTASSVGAVSTSGGTVNGAITFGKNDAYGIRTNTDNYGRIGDATNQFYEVYANTIYENKTKLAEKYAEKSHTHSNYLTGITKSMVTSALGYTPPTSDTNTWRPLGTTADTACAGNDSRLSNARPASDVYAWAKESSPNNIFKGGTYTGNIDSYSDSTLQPGKSYYISTSNITSSYSLPFSGYGVLGSYVTASVIVQQIFRYNGSSKIIDAIYTRMYINSAWTSWSKVALTKVS